MLLRQQMFEYAQHLKVFLDSNTSSSESVMLFYDQVCSYFQLQDDRFYARIRAAHADDPSALKKIDYFENDLKELKVKLYALDESAREKASGIRKAVEKQWGLLIGEIKTRIQQEEHLLYPLLA